MPRKLTRVLGVVLAIVGICLYKFSAPHSAAEKIGYACMGAALVLGWLGRKNPGPLHLSPPGGAAPPLTPRERYRRAVGTISGFCREIARNGGDAHEGMAIVSIIFPLAGGGLALVSCILLQFHPSPWELVRIAGTFILGVGLLGVGIPAFAAWRRGFVAFFPDAWRVGDLPAGLPADTPPLRISGELMFKEDENHPFLDVPAEAARHPDGSLVVFIRAEVKRRWQGIQYAKLDGVWFRQLRPGSIEQVETGLLYRGGAPWPALQLRFIEGTAGKRRRLVVSFPTDELRELFRQELADT